MILIKQVGVYLNVAHFRFKTFISDVFKRHHVNLTPEQFLLIDMLWKEDTVSQQQLANILMKDKNSITKLIDGMEKKKLLVRIPDKNDRRLNLITLTKLGKSMEEEVTILAKKAVNTITKDIPEEHLTMFVQVLQKMNENMTEYSPELLN